MKKHPAKLIDVIICDEVRQENTGKLLIIGMYLDNIGVPRLPFMLPVLTFLCKWRFESGQFPLGTYQLVAPSGQIEHTHCIETAEPQPESAGQILVPIRVQPFRITETGEYRLHFKPDGGRRRTIARFHVHTPEEKEENSKHEDRENNHEDTKNTKEDHKGPRMAEVRKR